MSNLITAYDVIGTGAGNLNAQRVIMDTDAPTFDPMTEYLQMTWRIVRAYARFAPATTTAIEFTELLVVQPIVNPDPAADDAAIMSEAPGIPLNYHFMTDPVEQLQVWYYGQQNIYSLDYGNAGTAVTNYNLQEMVGSTDVYSTDQYPVLIFGTSGITAQNIIMNVMVEYTWALTPK